MQVNTLQGVVVVALFPPKKVMGAGAGAGVGVNVNKGTALFATAGALQFPKIGKHCC